MYQKLTGGAPAVAPPQKWINYMQLNFAFETRCAGRVHCTRVACEIARSKDEGKTLIHTDRGGGVHLSLDPDLRPSVLLRRRALLWASPVVAHRTEGRRGSPQTPKHLVGTEKWASWGGLPLIFSRRKLLRSQLLCRVSPHQHPPSLPQRCFVFVPVGQF